MGSNLVVDALVIKNFLKIGPGFYEVRQANLHRWNPVGVVSLIISSVLGTFAALGYMGSFLQNTAAFFAAILASILAVVIAMLTKGLFYVKKEVHDIPSEDYIA